MGCESGKKSRELYVHLKCDVPFSLKRGQSNPSLQTTPLTVAFWSLVA